MNPVAGSQLVIGLRRLRYEDDPRQNRTELYVLDHGHPVAGPWPRDKSGEVRAAEWLIEHEMKELGPGKTELFEECVERAGGWGSADRFQLLFLINGIRAGWPRARVLKYAGRVELSYRRIEEPETHLRLL